LDPDSNLESDPELITDPDPNLQIISDPDAQHCCEGSRNNPVRNSSQPPACLVQFWILLLAVAQNLQYFDFFWGGLSSGTGAP
jgi:hypothetical protein